MQELSDIEILEIDLSKKTSIVKESFDLVNLEVVSVSYCCNENSISKVWVELKGKSGNLIITPKDGEGIYFHINLYGGDKILASESKWYKTKSFLGYDTIEFHFYEKNLLHKVTSAKLFVSFN